MQTEIILESGDYVKEPTIENIVEKLNLVLKGVITRESVAAWADEFVMKDIPTVEDTKVWELLTIVSGIDIKDSPEEYLHNDDDITNWIKQFS